MDIFSATSKQVETATAPKVSNPIPTRQVEQTADTTKVNQQQSQNTDTKKTLTDTVKELNKQMDLLDTNLTFGFNDKIDVMYVNVMEKSTGKVIRKFPTDEAMKLSEKMKEIVGIIFDKKG
ncbi:flagellar protein FlaG [Sulfurospirillum diekertiae]|uniref:FlaG family protein n=1 Tax=Sulfurospirillum diekertiae TaxID=1854492 RepID=UPI001427732C|nr:FlaG family protein [Sulfurospirillum diekertiae]QIR79726.1 flagellar protein FlaG [Sulfurospirillum diekertiae]